MTKKFVIEGVQIFQDIATKRKPIYVQQEQGKRVTLEKLIIESGIVPTAVAANTSNKYFAQWNPELLKADYVEERNKHYGEVTKNFIQSNMKKVRITVTIEEL